MNDIQEKDAQIIIALSFGQGRDGKPGLSNEKLAQVVGDLADKYGLPVAAQWEIAGCIPGIETDPRNLIVRNHRQPGQYLDTYEVLAQAWEHCQKFDFKNAIIVAHPDHAPRVIMTAQKIGFQTVVADTSSVPYDPVSAQEWTQSREKFLEREKIAFQIYKDHGLL